MIQLYFITLLIDPPTVSILNESSVEVNVLDVVELVCIGYGLPLPNLAWTRDGNQPLPQDHLLQNSTHDGNGDSDGLPYVVLRLVFTVLSEGSALDSGYYQCRGTNGVSNLIGTPEEVVVMVTVLGKALYLIG